jgi:hypothetical protein
MSFKAATWTSLFSRVSHSNIISDSDLTTAANLLYVFRHGLEMLREHTFWIEILTFGIFLLLLRGATWAPWISTSATTLLLGIAIIWLKKLALNIGNSYNTQLDQHKYEQ